VRRAPGDQPRQRRDDRVGVDAALHQHRQRLARELVNEVSSFSARPSALWSNWKSNAHT
jgi:hypothetical protein